MEIDMKSIPEYVMDIAKSLSNHGFQAYLVGGSLRDVLMKIKPNDYDIATDALPEETAKIFPKSILTGIKFGTVKVLVNNGTEDEVIDVTTFRNEEDYINGRWPSKVGFTKSIEEDLSRRDFTINAMALNLTSENHHQLIDLFNGIEDFNNKIIRAVRDPIERFNEDGLRPFRACRLASVLGFEIEGKTFEAISKTLSISRQVSIERIRTEFIRMLYESKKPSIGIELMRKSGLLEIFLPELLEGFGMEQNPFHTHDVYGHLLQAADIAPQNIRLAALLHDIGKPRKKSGEHFYGHDIEGGKMTREIMNRMKFPTASIEKVSELVRWHMFYYPETSEEELERIKLENDPVHDNDEIEKSRKQKRNEKMKDGWSDNAIRRFIVKVGGIERVNELIELRIADALSTKKEDFDPNEMGFQELQKRIADVLMQDNALKISDLKINGNDLKDMGIEEGPKIRDLLKQLLEEVIDNPQLNTKEDLRREVKKYIKL